MKLKNISKSETVDIQNIILPYIINYSADAFNYVWKVSDKSWNKLGLDFNHKNFNSDDEKRLAVKNHVALNWNQLNEEEKLRVAQWIISDWGGVKRNKDETILEYVSFSLSEPKKFSYKGISSYSKILSFTNPNIYAIYDARVASSLNCLLLEHKSTKFIFPVPSSQNKAVKNFTLYLKTEAINRNLFFIENVYDTYLDVLEKISTKINKPIDYIEGILFTNSENLIHKSAIFPSSRI
jgi:hypothetical protein